MIHECGKVGHIEDISVAKSEQGKKLGYYLVTSLTKVAQENDCYKVILDCSLKMLAFMKNVVIKMVVLKWYVDSRH